MKLLFSLSCMLLAGMTAFAARVDTVTIETRHLATPAKAVVVTPETGAAGAKYPTVYILHGHSGRYDNWITKKPQLKELADEYGMVLVMPDGRNSWYWDSPVQPAMQMESFFTQDLVPYVDAHYPTIDDASQRAITGLSMGGHGAMWLAMRHSDIWHNAGAMSGGVDILPFAKKWNMKDFIGTIDENPELWQTHTVINLVPSLQPGQLNITFDCGIDDFFHEVNDNLHAKMVECGIPHDYTVRPGSHTWGYWQNSILYHLLFFNQAFEQAKPTAK